MLSDAAIRLALLTQLKKLGQADQEALALLSPSTTTVLPVGSGLDNGPIESLVCANSGINPRSSCGKPGTQKCSNCHLVKYCSKQCQTLHWSKHRLDCKHVYLKRDWQPAWVTQKRTPAFFAPDSSPLMSFGHWHSGHYLWGNVPAVDCLQILNNEGPDAVKTNFMFAFAASGDIRNLVRTVNGLPNDYRGKCDILCNDRDSVVVNRNLVILFVLLRPEFGLDEAAELATHLMYSAALPPSSAANLYRCINAIYNAGNREGDPIFQSDFNTRGRGKLHQMQVTTDMKEPMRMLLSKYTLSEGLKGMRNIMLSPSRVDYRDRYLAGLKPAHRLASLHFRERGVLVPFSVDVSHFTEPNRLLFSPDGDWLTLDNANPLFGWDSSAIWTSGRRHGADSADVYGCLFFHVRDQFQEFARRARDFHIDIYLTQFSATPLSRSIAEGMLGPFGPNCFDRVETSNIVDYMDVPQVLKDWGPLLNRRNKHATLLMYFMNWHMKQPGGTPNERSSVRLLLKRSASILGVDMKREFLSGGMQSAGMCRAMSALEAFYDNEPAFRQYLDGQGADSAARAQGLRLRPSNQIHSKRIGIPLDAPRQKLPNLSKEEFYDLFVIGGGEFPVRFVEFEKL